VLATQKEIPASLDNQKVSFKESKRLLRFRCVFSLALEQSDFRQFVGTAAPRLDNRLSRRRFGRFTESDTIASLARQTPRAGGHCATKAPAPMSGLFFVRKAG
jgi:hypothetical protein